MAKRVAKLGVFVALAMIFSYVEAMIPFNFGIPGVKLGIANIVTTTALYQFKPKDVFMISFTRIFLMGLLFGSGVSLAYSLAGGMLSFVIMLVCKKTGFSVIGVSVAGGAFHNIGQVVAATLILQNKALLYYYLPILLVAGMITGGMIGILSGKILRSIKAQEFCREF